MLALATDGQEADDTMKSLSKFCDAISNAKESLDCHFEVAVGFRFPFPRLAASLAGGQAHVPRFGRLF